MSENETNIKIIISLEDSELDEDEYTNLLNKKF